MGLFNTNLPYTNLHEINLDWIIKEMKKLREDLESISAISPATSISPMDGIGAVGTSLKYAREDHQHTSDTTRATQTDMNSAKARLDVNEANIQTLFNNKQKKLVAGSNIIITPHSDYDTISASGEITVDYPSISNKPTLNGVTIVGDQTSEDYNIYHKLMLFSDGTKICSDSTLQTELTYVQIKTLLDNATNDVELWNGNYILRPEYTTTQGETSAIWFNATTSLADKTYLYRIAINSNNQVTNDEYELAQTSDIPSPYTLPIASTNTLGGIKVGNNLTITNDGVLNASGGTYTLPIASANTLGGIKISNGLRVDPLTGETDVQPATENTIGGIMVGDGLSIDTDGVLSASGLTMDLLWTNASHTSPFAGQTISLDLTNYKSVFILLKLVGDWVYPYSSFMLQKFEQKQRMISTCGASGSYAGTLSITSRDCLINSNSITFDDAYNGTTYFGINNNNMIPFKIYGIK